MGIEQTAALIGLDLDGVRRSVLELFALEHGVFEVLDDRSFLVFESAGLEIKFGERGFVSTVFVRNSSEAMRALCLGQETIDRKFLRRVLGPPDEHRGEQRIPVLGAVGSWEKWKRVGFLFTRSMKRLAMW